MLHPYNCPHCDSLGFVSRDLIGKVIKCLNCGKIMIMKDGTQIRMEVPKTLHATVGKGLSREEIRKMNAITTVNVDVIDAEELEVLNEAYEQADIEESQEIDADDLAVDY